MLAIAVIPLGLAIGWGLPNTESWAADDISPWPVLRVPKTYFVGWHKYPYLHPWLCFFLVSPYLAYLVISGGLDLGCFPSIDESCFSDPAGQFSVLMLHVRALGVAMGLGTIAAIYVTTWRLTDDRRAALLAAAITGCTAGLAAYAGVGTLDVPQCFWFAVSLAFFAGIVRGDAFRDYLGLGLAAGCALGTKEGIVGAYPALFLAAAWLRWRRIRGEAESLRALFDRKLLSAGAGVVGVYALATNMLLNPSGFLRHLEAWSPSGERMGGFHAEYPGHAAFLSQMFDSLALDLGTPLLVFCGMGVGFALWRRSPLCWLLLPALSYAVLSLGFAGYAPVRLLLPEALLLAGFGGALGSAWLALPGLRARIGAIAIGIALAHGFYHSLATDVVRLDDSRYRAEAWLAREVQPGSRIGVVAKKRALPRLDWLGFERVRIPIEDEGWAAVDASGVEWIVLSDYTSAGVRKRFRDELAALEAGELGFEPLATFRHRALPGEPRPIAKVSPRIVVLRRRPAEDGSTDPSPPLP